jgi:hypothetical protein
MVWLHESDLRENVLANSSPSNAYMSQYRRLHNGKKVISQHCHPPWNARYYVHNLLISSPTQISGRTSAVLAYVYRSYPHSLQINVRLIDPLATTVYFLILCN